MGIGVANRVIVDAKVYCAKYELYNPFNSTKETLIL